jgi:hypothetical protein
MRLLARLTLAVLVPALVACHRGPSTTDLSPPPSRATLRGMPGWYLKPPRDAQYVFGAATAVSQDLQIAIDKAQAEGRAYRAYVLMELPTGEAAKRLMEQVKANEQMYTRFRSTEAFKELDAEVQRYEAWKRDQKLP